MSAEPLFARDLRSMAPNGQDPRVAVEAVVIDTAGRWVLHRRGACARDEVGKLEGLGGAVSGEEALRHELVRELREEAGVAAVFEIERFLGTTLVTYSNDEQWLIASFLCRLVAGDLRVAEPEKNQGFVRLGPPDVDPTALSQSALATFRSHLACRADAERFEM